LKDKKNLTFVQFETDSFYQIVLDLVLLYFGMKPAIKITNRDELREYVGKLQSNPNKPDFAVIDTFIGINNEDGQKIAQKLRELCPGIKIVGYSIMESASWADFEIIKSNKDQSKSLVKILENALNEKFEYAKSEDPEYAYNG
jgi:hypothetical protein